MKLSKHTKKFISNSGWMMGQQIYSMIISLVVGSLSARYLGPSNYGLINYGASIISFFCIISKLGLDGVIINEMLLRREKCGSYLGTALVMRLMTSIGSMFIIAAIMKTLEPGNNELFLITMLQAIAIIFQSYEVLTYWFQMELKFKYVSIATIIASTIVAIWRIILLFSKASVEFFALSNSILYLVCGIVISYIFMKEKEPNMSLVFCMEDARMLIGKSYHLIISGLAITLYMQIDKIMIGKLNDTTDVGIYTAAATIAALWEFIPNSLINSARPLIMEQRKDNYKKYIDLYQKLLLAITALFVVVSVVMVLIGKMLILVLYGTKYIEAVLPLDVLIWSTGFAMIGTARSIWLVAEGYNKYNKHMVFIGAGVNFILNFSVIPKWGIVGASITTLISQIVVALISPLFFSKTRQFVAIYFQSFRQVPEIIKKVKMLHEK